MWSELHVKRDVRHFCVLVFVSQQHDRFTHRIYGLIWFFRFHLDCASQDLDRQIFLLIIYANTENQEMHENLKPFLNTLHKTCPRDPNQSRAARRKHVNPARREIVVSPHAINNFCEMSGSCGTKKMLKTVEHTRCWNRKRRWSAMRVWAIFSPIKHSNCVVA